MSPVKPRARRRPHVCTPWVALVTGLLIGHAVLAQTPPPAGAAPQARAAGTTPAWTSLTPPQKEALAPLERDWATMDSLRKTKWLEVAARFPQMSEADRQRIQERMREWVRMSPAERNRARLQFNEARQLSTEERQAQWEAYQALPEDTRKALATRKAAPPPPAAASQAAQAAAKRNVVTPPRVPPSPRTVRPAVVLSKPGATTTLLTQPAAPPLHQQTGLPKITATEGFVNPATLLPERGPQGAAVIRPTAPAQAAATSAPLIPAMPAHASAAASAVEAAAEAASAPTPSQ